MNGELSDSNFARNFENKHTEKVFKKLRIFQKSHQKGHFLLFLFRGDLALTQQGIIHPVKRTRISWKAK